MTHNPFHRRRIGAALLGALLVLAACSSGEGASPSTTRAGGSTASTAKASGDGSGSAEVTSAPVGQVATSEPVPSSGCATADAKAVTLEKRAPANSDRWYLLTTPTGAKAHKPLPLVLDYHGLLEGADNHAKNSMLSGFGANHGFVVVTPNGTGAPVHWETGADRKANPDLVFTDALLDQVERDLCVDTSRIYSTGLSMGAIFSSAIACTMSDRITAVAPVAGLVLPEPCKPTRPVPVLTFHGTADPILLFNGGVGEVLTNLLSGKGIDNLAPIPKADLNGAGYPQAARGWAKLNGCKETFKDKDVTEHVIQRTFACPPDGPVVFDIVQGGGHTWPGTSYGAGLEKIMGTADQTVDANAVMWAFFQRFALPPDAGSAGGSPA